MLSQLGRSLLAVGITCCTLLPGIARAQATGSDSLRLALLQQARAGNPELTVLRAGVRSAVARVNAAQAREAPVLAAEIDEIPGGAELWNAGQLQLGIEQELFSGSRRSAAARVAAVEQRRQEVLLELAERTLGARLDRELSRWSGQLAIGRRLELEDALLRDVEEGLASRFATGSARYVDVLRIRTERLRVQSERADAGAAAAQARLGLLLLLGSDSLAIPDSHPGLALDSVFSAINVDSMLAALGATGTFGFARDLAEAEERRVAAERKVRFSGGVAAQRFGSPDHFTWGPALRVSATLPLAVARSEAALRAASALSVSESAVRESARRARLRTAMHQAADRYRAARDRVELFDAALLRGSRAEREAAVSAYRTGELTLIELLDFERALARAETDRIRAMIQARDSYADLFDLLRGDDE